MDFWLIILLAAGLSMDAFAVAVTNGMCYRTHTMRRALSTATAFGVAQGAMPLVGYLLGHSFSGIVERVDHWVALFLLSFIGGKMIYEAWRQAKHPEAVEPPAFSLRTLTVQAVATSIDALAVGLGLGALQVNIILAASVIAAVTFILCFAGVLLGCKFGALFKDKAGFLGGLILIFIGLNIFFSESGGWF